MRFLLLDRIVSATPGERLQAVKHVALADPSLAAHYPRRAVMPASLVTEGLAQAGGMLNCLNHDFGVEMVLMLVDGVRVHRQVLQGDTLALEVEMLYDHPYGATMRGCARVGDAAVVSVDRLVYAHEIVTSPEVVERNRWRLRYQGAWPPATESA